MRDPGVIETDALVIGAGPVGLWQVFQLGLQGIHAHVVDVLDEAGGQCIELYPDKPIYDIPGLPHSTGRELTQRLLQQVAPFKPRFHFNQQVSELNHQPDGRWLVSTAEQRFLTRTLFIAAGGPAARGLGGRVFCAGQGGARRRRPKGGGHGAEHSAAKSPSSARGGDRR